MGKVLLELAVLLIFDKISVETIIKQKNLNLWRDFLNFPYFTGFSAH